MNACFNSINAPDWGANTLEKGMKVTGSSAFLNTCYHMPFLTITDKQRSPF